MANTGAATLSTETAILSPATPACGASQSARKGSLSPVKTNRALKDPINITIYDLRNANPTWTWSQTAEEVSKRHNLIAKPISHHSCHQRHIRTVDAYSQLSAQDLEAMRSNGQIAERDKIQSWQQQLGVLVHKAKAMIDGKGTRWRDVADLVNVRLRDVEEHLSATEVQRVAEEESNVRYDRLVAAAVLRGEEKYWQDVANLVNFQVETFRDEGVSVGQIREMAT